MIFVTVGTQLPFERLIRAVDGWAKNNPNIKIFAQIGPTEFQPSYIESVDFLTPNRADHIFREATIVVSHAGMGSILTALKYRKPILILPRKAALGECRNDHQLATAKRMGTRSGVTVAWSEEDVQTFLDDRRQLVQGEEISENADPQLVTKLRDFILKAL